MTESEPYYAADEMWTGVEDTRPLWPWVVGAAVALACAAGALVILFQVIH